MRVIETSHLKTWASSKAAESRLPYIVKSLIQAVIQPEKLRMPFGDAVWVPGFDGAVINSETNRFVPVGLSVWELGTSTNFKAKAQRDYAKRSTDKSGSDEEKSVASKLDRSQATFVFVTPHVWQDKDDWIAERKQDGVWKDIVIIDGVDLQDWLAEAPAVDLQFAAELGLVPEAGLQTPDQAWEEWSHLTSPPASEDLVVAGREEQEKELIDHLKGPPATFTVRGDSPREAWGFVLAVLRRAGSEGDLLNLHARTIMADDEDVARRLRHLENLIIVLKQARGQVSGFLSRRGCYVIVPEGNDARSERNVVVLTRPTRQTFADALREMGLSDDEAERQARACGRSVTILQRQLAHANLEPPRWSDAQNIIHLLPALLAGRWNNRNDFDREILRQLADAPDYNSVEGRLQQFLFMDEPPLQRIDEMWTLTAPVDAFQLGARYLAVADLNRFKSAFREVFGRIDPNVEVPPEEWPSLIIRENASHSQWLKSGMAETLLLIAERGVGAEFYLPSPSGYAAEVVRGLPGLNNDWRLLASIRDQYARLMEAAPGPFLDSLERLLDTKPDDMRRLFAEGGLLGTTSMHTGILWGLEALAWSPQYLTRVTLILAKLARIDPGGRLSNRPINSLRDIFLWWYPGTHAPIETRLNAIDLILDRAPDVGWDLIAALLPTARQSITTGTAKPLWRDIGDLPEDARTRRGQIQYVTAIVDRVLDHVGSNPDRWQAILDSLRVLTIAQQTRALELLEAIAANDQVATERKSALWEVLRDFIHKHRTFQDANWAVPRDLIDQLEAILSLLAPDDPVERNRWLFDEWLPDLLSQEEDFDQRQQQTEALRQQAVAEILQGQGIEGLVRLGTLCHYPGLVAAAVVPLMVNLEAVYAFVERAISAGEAGISLAGHISGQAQRRFGDGWSALVRKEGQKGTWPSSVVASLLVWWPDSPMTWNEAEALGVAAEYWRGKQPFALEGTPEEQVYQIDRLIEVERAAEVFSRVALRGKTVPTETLVRLFDATLNEIAQLRTREEMQRLRLDSYYVRKFLGELRNRADLPREQLAVREYQALPLLGSLDVSGLAIYQLMAEDPDFFVQLLCDAFLPAHRDKSQDPEPTAEMQVRARTAFSLLKGMEQVPGRRQGTQIDEAALLQWAKAVRRKAAKVDRAVIADQLIGQVLAHSSEDPEDGGWPHRTVRNAIEILASDDIDRGLSIERFNMRGVYRKAMYEGGDQERVLARQYRGWADISRTQWPRMARVLESIAESWDRAARREDARAEQEKLE